MRKMKMFLLVVIMLICRINIIIVEASEDVKFEKAEKTVEDKEFEEKEDEEELASKDIDIDEPEQEDVVDVELMKDQEIKKDETEIEEVEEIEESREIEQELTEENPDRDYIYNVSFPTDSKAYLDPENLSGKGQIFSDEFKIENYGNIDIAIKIKNIGVNYRTTEDLYEFSEDKIIDKRSHVKKLNVDMIWKNKKENTEKLLHVVEGTPDEYVLSLKASEYDENGCFVGVDEGSVGSFYFTGTLSSNPEIDWKNGEISVSFGYEIVMIEEDDEENIEPMDNYRTEEEEN